nr:reverse transcriptase domain-containing protein [Tanacetum cinerariifolium]
MATEGNGDPPVPDLQTMEELCQPSLNGRGGPIAPIAIQETNFGLKNDMIPQILFCNGLTLRHRDTINAAAGGTFMKRRLEECYDLIENMTAHHNDWDTSAQRSKSSSSITSSFDSKIAALKTEMAEINKNLMKVLQINHQVKAVTPSCETCSGPHSYNDCPATVGQTQNVYAAGAYNQGGFDQNQNRNNQNQNFQNQNRNQGNNHPQGNNQGRNQFFQGASHGQNPPPAYQEPAYQALSYQAPVHQPPIPQPQVVTTTEFTNYMKANDSILKNIQTNMTSLTKFNLELKNMFGQFMKMNTTSSSGSKTLPSNTITNPKEDLKGVITRNGNAYQGPTIPTTSSSLPRVVERETEVTKDTVPPTNNGSTKDVKPLVVQTETPIPHSEPIVTPVVEPIVAPISSSKPNQKPSISYPSRLHDQKLRDKANDQKEKFFQIFKDLDFNISFADALILMKKKTKGPDKFLIPYDFLEMDECLALADLDASINLMPLFVWNKLSLPELTLTLMPLELTDQSISRPIGVVEDVFVKVGKFHFLANFVVVDFDADPRVPLILGRSFLKTGKALIDVYEGELTLHVGKESVTFNLDQTSRYSANYNDMTANQIDVIDMACEEYLEEVLGFSDVIVSGNPTPYYDPIVSTSSPTLTPFGDSDFLLEEVDAFLTLKDDPTSPKVDHSYYDTEGDILLLEAFLNDDPLLPPPTQGSPWVSPVHCIPKKGGFTIVENEENELIPTRLVTVWRVCIDYRKLNEATRKDHFPLPFMDQMLERFAGNEYYCFLDGFSGYFQIPIDPKEQEKTTFACPYRTFAYRRMPFSLCNVPGTFQRCMMAIFHDMIEKTMEVFIDDFLVFGNSFGTCLSHLNKMLKLCEDTNLCLNWEKIYFMVKEGIVLGHKISKNGIKVDKAKVDVIAKLPHPTTIKGIRSFLVHAGFYRRFIQDFSKIAQPMTRLLEKDIPFFFLNECIEAFQTLKKKLTEAPILGAPIGTYPLSLCAMQVTLP